MWFTAFEARLPRLAGAEAEGELRPSVEGPMPYPRGPSGSANVAALRKCWQSLIHILASTCGFLALYRCFTDRF